MIRISIVVSALLGIIAMAAGVVRSRGCIYDPVAEVPHREFPTTTAAIEAILAEVPPSRVYAVGEYHQTRAAIGRQSPLARFTGEIIALLEPRARHLVVEAWLDDGCKSGAQVEREVAAAIRRPPSSATDLAALVVSAQRLQLIATGLAVTCIEHGAVLDAHGHVDFLRLLELITQKLGDTTRALLAADPTHAVIVYGGALHNDLYPAWPLADLSYAAPLAAELGGGVLELDLVVPEIVETVPMVRIEPWFPLLGRASPDRVLVWRRGPGSYVLILPAQTDAGGAFARPIVAL